MNGSPYEGVLERLNAESKARMNVENEMATIQSQINHLGEALMTTATTFSAPMTSTSTSMNFSVQSPSPANPMMFSAPRMPVFNNQFQPPTLQPTVQQLNFLAQINMLNCQLQSLRQEFLNSGRNITDLYDEIGKLKNEMNEQKQYGQRNNLIAHGWDDVPIPPRKPTHESTEAFTNYVVGKLNNFFPNIEGGITARDIDDTHIYRTKNSDRNSHKQLVIIRFCSRLLRNKVFSMKKELKDTGFSLTEHLTKFNLALLKAAQKKLGNVKNAWTHYGKVLVHINGVIKSVRNFDDLDYLTSY